MKEAFAYIDPSQGWVFIQNTSFLWIAVLGIIGFFIILAKFLFKLMKKFFWIFFIIVVMSIIAGVIMGNQHIEKKKIVILGVDAMDPNITEQLINEGNLPNFSYLKTRGSYSHLETTNPAESIVAWASFATGLSPGAHGIFDFIMRKPPTYTPYLSLNEISDTSRNEVKIYRKGQTFWKILSKNKIPSFIFLCPNTFPPDAIHGKIFSGMGVTDVYGTMGRFLFYSSKEMTEEEKEITGGKLIYVKPENNVIRSHIDGPRVLSKGMVIESNVPLEINIQHYDDKIQVKFQKIIFSLKKGSWSNWQKIYFKIGPFKNVYGIVKFYLKNIEPDFELYLSPINFDPEKPPFPISYPKGYSQELAKRIGLYSTLGMPHDTWGLSQEILNEEAFLEQVNGVFEEKRKILNEGLKDFKNSGVFFFYFDTLDVIQHMFWRFLDSNSPLFVSNSPYKDTIFKYYRKIDQSLGEILKMLDRDTILIVISDHGFNTFKKNVHLNRWLLENGFLFLQESKSESKEFFREVDWSKTKAYALGFGGVYINKIGREGDGIVDEIEYEQLRKIILEKLKHLQDPQTQEEVIRNVYRKEEIFNGPYIEDAPDLFVGFNVGYRASWQTALGAVPRVIIEDNKKKWSGDHLIDPSLVPGVIFINKKVNLPKNCKIIDMVPTILELFNINYKELEGKSLL